MCLLDVIDGGCSIRGPPSGALVLAEHGSLAFYSLSSKITLKDHIVRLRKPGMSGAGLDAQASNRGLNIFLGFSYVFGA